MSEGRRERRPCPKCQGSGQVFDIIDPALCTIIGAAFAWYGWSNIDTLLTGNAVANQTVMFFSVAGPALIIFGWWKRLWRECPSCGGTGRWACEGDLHDEQAEQAVGRTIAEDRNCHKCGYNLRTQVVGHRCPECGETILAPEKAEQARQSRASLRWGILFAIAFPVGLIGSMLLFGSLGGLWFGGAWFLAYVIIRIIAAIADRR